MMEMIIKTITGNLLDIVISVLSIVVSYYLIPAIKDDLVPWLKEKHIYDMVHKFVQSAEKLAETGVIEKKDKKAEVVRLLQERGIEITDAVNAAIESAVKELDLITETVKNEILNEEKN